MCWRNTSGNVGNVGMVVSVTSFVKFRHFGKSLQVFDKFLAVYFLFGKMLSLLRQICDLNRLNFIVASGQILKNNLTIWSHWCWCLMRHNSDRSDRLRRWKRKKESIRSRIRMPQQMLFLWHRKIKTLTRVVHKILKLFLKNSAIKVTDYNHTDCVLQSIKTIKFRIFRTQKCELNWPKWSPVMWIFIKYDKLIQWLAYLSFWRKICKPNGYTFHPFRGMILVGGATTLVRYNDTSYNGLQLGLNLCVKMTKLNLTLPFSKPFSVTRWWNKKLPNFPRYCPKSIQIIFLPETCIIWNSPKRVPKYLGYFCKEV